MIAKIQSHCYFLMGKNLYFLGQYKKALTAFDRAAKLNLTPNISLYQKKTLKKIKIAEADLNKKQEPEELEYNQTNQQLSKQLEDIEGKFKTLQKQMSDLNDSSKLKSVVAAFNESKTENLIRELRQEVIELKTPNSINRNSNQFTEMQGQVTKLQAQLSEYEEKAEQDRDRLRKNSDRMKGLQAQVKDLESNTSAQVIDLQSQMNENIKRDQEDREKLKETTKQLEDHNLILQNTNAIDKVKADEYINYLKLGEPLLYIYYKTFYWTIHSFFHAHRVLSTDLISHNNDYTQTKKEKYLNNTKIAINKVNIVTKHIPIIGSFTEIVNDITHLVHNIVQTKKLKDITNIIINVVKSYNTIEKLDNTLLNSAILITDFRKEKILSLKNNFDNNLPKLNKVSLLKNLKKLKNFEPNITSINDEIAKLAIQDTILLICELLNKGIPDITYCIESILQTDSFKTSIEANIDNIQLFEEHIKIIGSTIALHDNIFEE